MREMFPRHNEHMGSYVACRQNGTYRSVILVKKDNGEIERELLTSCSCATMELALEEMTFIQQQRYARVLRVQPDNRQGWLQSLREDWQTTQQLSSLGGSSASRGT